MQANADFAPLLLRLLQCGSWALKRPLSPRRQAGGRATGAAWRRLLAPLLCFLSTCRISADNFLSVFRSSLRRAARRAAPLLFVSLGCCFFFFLPRARVPLPLVPLRLLFSAPAPGTSRQPRRANTRAAPRGGVHTRLEREAERDDPGDRECLRPSAAAAAAAAAAASSLLSGIFCLSKTISICF